VTILVTNNFLFCKLVAKLVTVVTNNYWSLFRSFLVVDSAFFVVLMVCEWIKIVFFLL